jgi:hypothetical protein
MIELHLFRTCSAPAPKFRQQTKPYHKTTISRNLKHTLMTNNGVETTTSNTQKWSKYLIQYNFIKKNTRPLAPTTKGAKLKKTKCEE